MVESESSSIYAVIANWVTPSFLFLFINLVIGIIAVMSRFANNHRNRQRADSPGRLARSPSLFGRAMSFGFNKYHSPEEHEFVTRPDSDRDETRDSPLLARAPSLLDRVKSINLGLLKSEEKEEDPKLDDTTRKELTRRPSLVERLKSMTLYRSGSANERKEEPVSGSEHEPETGSEPEPRRRYSRKWEGEEEEEVDKKADDFIKRFKQQLRMQRLDSILRYRDMLKRN